MTVEEILTGCSLSIEVQSGTDKLGDPIYKKKTFSNINHEITTETLFEFATAIEGVIEAKCKNYFKNNTSKLMTN